SCTPRRKSCSILLTRPRQSSRQARVAPTIRWGKVLWHIRCFACTWFVDDTKDRVITRSRRALVGSVATVDRVTTKEGNDMIVGKARTIGFFTTIVALTLAAGVAFAQETQISGTVSGVDPTTRTVSFADGSVVRLQPGAVVMVNGRQASLEQLTPGTSATIVSRVPGTSRSASSVGTSPASSAYGVTGTVA